MIIVDTHIWLWWVDDEKRLTPKQIEWILKNEKDIIGVSAISCWEIAKLVELGKLGFSIPVIDWLNQSLEYPGIKLIGISPDIAVESTQLPGSFHRDPADQIIVATARIYNCPLVTSDEKIIKYPYVETII